MDVNSELQDSSALESTPATPGVAAPASDDVASVTSPALETADLYIREIESRLVSLREERERRRRERAEALQRERRAWTAEVHEIDRRRARIEELLGQWNEVSEESEGELVERGHAVLQALEVRRAECVAQLQFDPRESADLLQQWRDRAATVAMARDFEEFLADVREHCVKVDPEDFSSFLREHVGAHPLRSAVAGRIQEISDAAEARVHSLYDPAQASRLRREAEERAEREQRRADVRRRARELFDQVDQQQDGLDELDREEVRAQLEIWACDAKILGAEAEELGLPRLTEVDRVFAILVRKSKKLNPGFTVALKRGADLNWAEFREGAHARLLKAIEARRQRELRREAAEKHEREQRQRDEALALRAKDAADWIRAFLVDVEREHGGTVPEENGADFRKFVHDWIEGTPKSSDLAPDLVVSLEPYADWLRGPEFKRLRRAFEKRHEIRNVAIVPAEPMDSLRRRVLARVVEKFREAGKVGGSHTAVEHVLRGFPDHEKSTAREAYEVLVREDLVLEKTTSYGKQFSLAPHRMRDLEEIAEGRSTLPRIADFVAKG